jgi:hypothetical protein
MRTKTISSSDESNLPPLTIIVAPTNFEMSWTPAPAPAIAKAC